MAKNVESLELALMAGFCVLIAVLAIVTKHRRVVALVILALFMVGMTFLGRLRNRRRINTLQVKGRRRKAKRA
ncbi:hypothetical protein LJC74_07230 [Eubacteriales bacterium OttesenSCG-928-A19]|nr:hypothetical protein [Eubacteriales bacterium OttesenSCG-928-A19]